MLQTSPAYPLREQLLLCVARLPAVLLKLAQEPDRSDVVAEFCFRAALSDRIIFGDGEIVSAIMRRRSRGISGRYSFRWIDIIGKRFLAYRSIVLLPFFAAAII
ncbi:hypothetical protein ELZ22_17660 [Brucella abortus]|nr:hypothetical protein ELZ22_17660 [Brucella abortus]